MCVYSPQHLGVVDSLHYFTDERTEGQYSEMTCKGLETADLGDEGPSLECPPFALSRLSPPCFSTGRHKGGESSRKMEVVAAPQVSNPSFPCLYPGIAPELITTQVPAPHPRSTEPEGGGWSGRRNMNFKQPLQFCFCCPACSGDYSMLLPHPLAFQLDEPAAAQSGGSGPRGPECGTSLVRHQEQPERGEGVRPRREGEVASHVFLVLSTVVASCW